MKTAKLYKIALLLICLVMLTACGGKSITMQKSDQNPSGKVKNAPYVVFGQRYVPFSVQAAKSYNEVGIASWYGSEMYWKGKVTAIGEPFTEHGISAAHKLLPLPCWVRVTNLDNGRTLIVRVNDRGPFKSDRIIDLSKAAAKELGFLDKGTTKVRVEFIRYD